MFEVILEYEALTDFEKSFVSNYDVLLDSINEFEKLPTELTVDNFYDFLRLEISLENWTYTSRRDFLGFMNYHHTANIRIRCTPLRDHIFEYVKFSVRWRPKSNNTRELYSNLINSFHRMDFVLGLNSNAELTHPISGEFLLVLNPPNISLNDFDIEIISGNVIRQTN